MKTTFIKEFLYRNVKILLISIQSRRDTLIVGHVYTGEITYNMTFDSNVRISIKNTKELVDDHKEDMRLRRQSND